MRIGDKRTMYELLTSGRLGNTNPSWPDCQSWRDDPRAKFCQSWGVRSSTHAGDRRTAMYVPTHLVKDHARRFGDDAYNLSPMIDTFLTVTAMLEVHDSDAGLVVGCVAHPPKGIPWRWAMSSRGCFFEEEGVTARMLLRRFLNPNSLDDLYQLLEAYPGHVVELSATEQEYGTHPGRNAVVWEVRDY